MSNAIQNEQKNRIFQGCSLLLILTATLFLAGCDDSFNPLQENDRYFFSIQGFLDASADTQWVRLSPVRETIAMPDQIPEMLVTLKQLGSETNVVMQDSILTDEDGFNRSMVWTEMDVQPGQTYHLSAESTGGSVSHVTVSIPEDFPTPAILEEARFGRPSAYHLFITGVDRLADLQTRWHIRVLATGQDLYFIFPYRGQEVPTSDGYRLYFDSAVERQQIEEVVGSGPGRFEVIERQVYIAAAGPEWNEQIETLNDLLYVLPESWSNIENGIGYMVGIVSKSIPYRSCLDESGTEPVPCPEVKPFVQ